MTFNKHSILYTTLARGLSMKRPHNTPSVDYFTQWLWQELPVHLAERAFLDDCDNLHVDNRHDGDSRTLFIAHVDTVHRETGANKIRKTDTHWHANGAPLGADDGAGCAMLMHLIHNDVAGYYIFSQGEECGGIGAKYIADKYATLLSEFDRAIAFDRRGIDSVITHQGWGRCCSDAFGQALSDALNADDRMMYLPDDSGVYTDTAEFVDIIPECTNISVGYMSEHTANESLNIKHFIALSEAVLNVPWDKLPTSRKAGEVEDRYNDNVYGSKYSAGQLDSVGMGRNWWRNAFEEDALGTGVLQDALTDAEFGWPDELLYMAAESVYPEDPDFALKFLDKKKCTAKAIKRWQQLAESHDMDSVLAIVFDTLHMPQ